MTGKSLAVAVLVSVLVFGAAVAAKLAVWAECRREHSVLYCMSLVGR